MGQILKIMENPWVNIPYEDYEGHMNDPSVGQLQALATITRQALEQYRPEKLLLLGAATGNGLQHVDPLVTRQVVCVDINPQYLQQAKLRYSGQLPGLQTICADLDRELPQFGTAGLVIAALLIEYVDPLKLMHTIHKVLAPEGTAILVIQENNPNSFVATSRYNSLQSLECFAQQISENHIREMAAETHLNISQRNELKLNLSRRFIIFHLQPF